MNKFKLLFLIVIINSCSSFNDKYLTKEDIIKIVNHSEIRKEKYYHFEIKRKDKDLFDGVLLNNRFLPSVNDSLSDIINFKDTYIFVYDESIKLKDKQHNIKNRHLISGDGSPFFILSECDVIKMRIHKNDSILLIEEYKFKTIERFPNNHLEDIDW